MSTELRLSGDTKKTTSGDDYIGQQRAVDTRRAILEEAARLFAERGFEGCSTRDIASAAGVSHANIRYHFGDKDELWLRVIKFLIVESYHGTELLSRISESENAVEIFRQHTQNTIRYFAYHPELSRIIHFEEMVGSDRYEKVRDWLQELENERVGHIKAMQKSGVVKSGIDPHQLNAFIGGALTNVFIANLDIDKLSKPKKEKMIEQYTDLIISLVSA